MRDGKRDKERDKLGIWKGRKEGTYSMRVIYPHPVLKIDSTLDELHVDSVQSNSEKKS